VREVGFELYQEMLHEAISKLQSGEIEMADDGEWSPRINLGVPVLIPEKYVPDLDVRLGLYRRLSSLEKKVEMEGFAAELIDRFGKLPAEVETLMLVVRIKALCKRAGIAKLDGGPKGATVAFHNDKFANPAGLVEYLHAQDGRARVKDNKIIIRRNWQTDRARLQGSFAIARDLAVEAKGGKDAVRRKKTA
jgi:transcription-repair coupling factor (superfamily II helicase)